MWAGHTGLAREEKIRSGGRVFGAQGGRGRKKQTKK